MNRQLVKQRNQQIWELYNDAEKRLTARQIADRYGITRRAVYHVIEKFEGKEETSERIRPID
jgi:GTP-sensing pleiotropic transcriptional regulator CodY